MNTEQVAIYGKFNKAAILLFYIKILRNVINTNDYDPDNKRPFIESLKKIIMSIIKTGDNLSDNYLVTLDSRLTL